MMKKIYLVLLLAILSLGIQAQNKGNEDYFKTHDPNPDSLMTNFTVNTDNGFYTVIGVDTVQGKSAEKLYESIKNWIGEKYNEPSKVIKSDNPGNQLVFEGELEDMFGARVVFKFREGRMRMEISSINILIPAALTKFMKADKLSVETRPKYNIINGGTRAAKWLLADLYPYLKTIKQVISKEEENW